MFDTHNARTTRSSCLLLALQIFMNCFLLVYAIEIVQGRKMSRSLFSYLIALLFLAAPPAVLGWTFAASNAPARVVTRNGARSMTMMPTLLVQSAKAIDNAARSQLLKDASKAVASALKKPEAYVMVSYKSVDGMMFGGSEEPCAFVHLASIGRITPETNPAVSKTICELLEKHLDIPSNRVYIQFYDSSAANFGWDKSTFG